MNQQTVVFTSALWLFAGAIAPTALKAEASVLANRAATSEDARLTGACAFFDGRQGGAGAHFAPGVLVLTTDTLRIHPGTADATATVVLRFADMRGAALRRYAGTRQVQIQTAAGVVVIEMTGRPGQPDTDAVMAELRAHRVPFWDSGRFYRRG